MPETISDRDMDLVCKQVNRMVIPISFDLDYNAACASYMEGSDEKIRWKAKEFSPGGLFQHICRLISTENSDDSIGRRFVLEQTGRSYYGLPHQTTAAFTIRSKKNSIVFTIPQVEVLLFKSGIGFVVIELDYGKQAQVDKIIEGNYFFKSCNRSDIEMSYLKSTGRDESTEVHLDSNQIALNITEHLKVSCLFDGKNPMGGNMISSAHALAYSALVLDQSFMSSPDYENRLKQYLFWMRRSFKESYKPAPNEFDLYNNPDVLQFFQNSFWGISVEGLANIVYLVDDEQSNKFFTGNYSGNLENTYFYIYIIALHERFALLKYIREAALIPYPVDEKDNLQETQDINGQIYQLRKKIAYLILRSSFYQVSNISHHNKLFEQLRLSLGIGDLHKELQFELKMLASLNEIEEQRIVSKINKAEQDRRDKRERHERSLERFITLISTMFVLITTTQAIWSMYAYYLLKQVPPLWSPSFWVTVITLVVMWLTTLAGYAYFTLRRRKA